MEIYIVLIVSCSLYVIFSRILFPYEDGLPRISAAKLIGPWVSRLASRSSVPRKIPKEEAWKFAIYKSLLKLSGIIFACAFFFSGFELWLENTTRLDLAEATIRQIELTSHEIRGHVKIFKVNPWAESAAIFMLIALAGSITALERFKILQWYKKFGALMGNTAQILAVFTAFTFFGVRTEEKAEERINDLARHKLKIIEDNKLLKEKIAEVFEDDIIDQFLVQPDIAEALNEIDILNNLVTQAEFAVHEQAQVSDQLLADKSISFRKAWQNHDWNRRVNQADHTVSQAYRNKTHHTEVNSITEFLSAEETKSRWQRDELWVEQHVSQKSTERANAVVGEFAQSRRSVFFHQYKEPLKKILKSSYNSTLKEWFKRFTEALVQEAPFFSSFIDIVVHDPLKEAIWEKTESIFRESHSPTQKGALTNMRKDVEQMTVQRMREKSASLPALKSEIAKVKSEMAESADNVFKQIAEQNARIEKMIEDKIKNYNPEQLAREFLEARKNNLHLRFPESPAETNPYAEIQERMRKAMGIAEDAGELIDPVTNKPIVLPSKSEWESVLRKNKYEIAFGKLTEQDLFHQHVNPEYKGSFLSAVPVTPHPPHIKPPLPRESFWKRTWRVTKEVARRIH